MSLGIVVLLAGVWIVSIKSSDAPAEGESIDLTDTEEEDEDDALLSGNDEDGDAYELEESDHSPEEETFGDLKRRMSHLYQAFLLDQAGPPRGFSVGISASSPGFAIRPTGQQQHLHARRNTAAAISGLPPLQVRHLHTRSDEGASALAPTSTSPYGETDPLRPSALSRTASEPHAGASASATRPAGGGDQEMLSHRHRRKRSLAGDFYVGASDPFAESPAFETPLSPTSANRSRSGSTASAQPRRQSADPESQAVQGSTGAAAARRGSALKRFLPWSTSPERVSQD